MAVSRKSKAHDLEIFISRGDKINKIGAKILWNN